MIDELISDVDTNSLRFSLEGVHGLLSSLALCGAGGRTHGGGGRRAEMMDGGKDPGPI